ncbi:hypothetical protein AB0D11_31980 [Streptomyces monashensis]|uniref:hypothetical protein n=1 Tax=Streptomyces monashensis TaxID=1678012 RepID=UPI0033D34ECB
MLEESRNDRLRGEWIPPLVSTLVTLPLALFLLVAAAFAPMACDSCTESEAHRFDASYDVAMPVFLTGLVISALLVLAGWCMPWTVKNMARRRLTATLAPCVLLLAYVFFAGRMAS